MKKLLGAVVASAFLLSACNVDREPPRPGPYGGNDTEESEDFESLAEETETETETETVSADGEEMESDTDLSDTSDEENTDEAIDLSIVMDEDFEEIDWNDVHLTRREFDSLLFEMQEDLNSDYEEDDEMEVVIDSIDFSGDTIHIFLTNHDESAFADFTTGFFAVFIDSLYRQLYLSSDYSDGTTHPRIIVQHTDGEIITDQDEFIEFEE